MTDEIARTGSLAAIAYPDLLQQLRDSGLTCALEVRDEEIVKTVYFREGQLFFASSNNPNDRLGEYLLRAGIIDLRSYLDSAKRIRPGLRQGTVLCEMGAIEPDDLPRHVAGQVSEIVRSLFAWTRGSFQVGEGAAAQEALSLNISIEDVILSGVRRVSDWERIWHGLGGTETTVFAPSARAGALTYHLQLSEEESSVLALVNGTFDIGKLLGLAYPSDFETCRILWALRLVGAIEPIDRPLGDSSMAEDWALAEVVDAYDHVFERVHAFVADKIEDLVDHFMDRVLQEAIARHPETLQDVHLRDQGRVEYEHVFANLSQYAADERRQAAIAALEDLLDVLLRHTGRELGAEEEEALRNEVDPLRSKLPGATSPGGEGEHSALGT